MVTGHGDGGFISSDFLKYFESWSLNKEARDTCWNIVTNLQVWIFDELRAMRVVAEYAFNHPDRDNELYLWGVLQDHRVMAEFVKEKIHWEY